MFHPNISKNKDSVGSILRINIFLSLHELFNQNFISLSNFNQHPEIVENTNRDLKFALIASNIRI